MSKWLVEVGDLIDSKPLIGVLGLQGAYKAHQTALSQLGCHSTVVRQPKELERCQALIMPGGESSTMGLLMERFGLLGPMTEFGQQGKPILATCAGLILLAKAIEGSEQLRLNLMDIRVQRNAYGRQQQSFATELDVPSWQQPAMPAVFIRAPKITQVLSNDVSVLAKWQGSPVFVEQDHYLGATFHPELSGHSLVHQYFVDKVDQLIR